MTLPIIVRPQAELDLLEAQRWYEKQRPGLGARYREAVDALLQQLSKAPLIHPVVYQGIRRASVHRFPYMVYYTVEPHRIRVIACFHSRRDPDLLLARIE